MNVRPTRRAAALALALAVTLPALAQSASTVFVNPRASADDPRIGLKPGMTDAGEAALGLEHLTTIPKPPAFVPPPEPALADGAAPARGAGLTYANSDLAFTGKVAIMGNFYGITLYDIADPAKARLLTTIVCPGGQGDVSVYKNLLFMSVEGGGRIDCGTQGIPLPAGYVPPARPTPPAPGQPAAPRPAPGPGPASPERIRGIRIFDISDITKPKQVAIVQTCRGSHTHTLLVDPKDKDNIYVYISGSAGVRPAEELAGCSGGDPKEDPNSAVYTIVVIKVPLAHPELAKVVSSPRIFQDPVTGAANGLWNGGNHGEGTQTTSATRGCHDITVDSYLGLAAGACSGNGILLNIKDPVHPVRLDAVSDPNYAFWHSANFTNDGKHVLFTDEWGGGTQPRCRASDPMNWGADAIFTLENGKLKLDSYYKMPAPQTDSENCVAHNGSLVPIPGRDILSQGWYQGGASLVDFTDPMHPMEIAYFDRGPIDKTQHITGGEWSVYWYNGYLYGSEIARGLDVFKLVPSKFITQNEIDAANQIKFGELNVQDQPHIVWPETFITAKAYLDQLARGDSLSAADIGTVMGAIDAKKISVLHTWASKLDKDALTAKTPRDAERLKALAEILKKSNASMASNPTAPSTGAGR